MKTTLDIPDTIYRQFKTRAAMNGETMRNATLNFIITYISAPESASSPPPPSISTPLPPWLGCAAKFARAKLDGPHDMSSVRASVAKKRFAKGVTQ